MQPATNLPATAVNWRELLTELHFGHRMTLVDIAMAISTHRDSIRNYINQVTTPSHYTGERLIALWQFTTKKPREKLPMVEALPSVARLRRG